MNGWTSVECEAEFLENTIYQYSDSDATVILAVRSELPTIVVCKLNLLSVDYQVGQGVSSWSQNNFSVIHALFIFYLALKVIFDKIFCKFITKDICFSVAFNL